MSSIVVAGDTSGSVTLQAPAVAGSTVLTLPATSGTVMVNGPAFSAYQSVAQSVTAATVTKITLTTVEFDTNSNYASSRFTPTVAGYYQASGRVQFSGFTQVVAVIYKNGVMYKSGNNVATNGVGLTVSILVYLNGTSDYVELYGYTGTTMNTSATIDTVYFQASMIRSA
jgi:hypothetical protein